MHVGREQPLPQVLLVFRCLLFRRKEKALGKDCSLPRKTFLGARHAFLAHERLLTWEEKRTPITADFQIWEVHFGPWEISRFTLSVYISRKDHKSFMKTEDLTVLEQTTQLTHKRLYLWLPSQSHWKKLSWGLNLLNGRRLYCKTITCQKKILPFVQSYKITPPLHHLKNNFTNKWHQIQPPQREIYKNPTLLS